MSDLEKAQERANEINQKISEMKSSLAAKVSKEDVAEAIKGALGEGGIDAIIASIEEAKNLAEEASLTANALKTLGAEAKAETLDAIVSKNFAEIKNVLKSSRRDAVVEFNVSEKALATVSAVTSTRSYRDNDLVPLDKRAMVMSDLWRHVTVGKDTAGTIVYIDWDAATTARAAASVAEGALFPESTVKWEEKTISMKKIGDSIPVTEEFAIDQSQFAGEIAMFLSDNVELALDSQLLLGNNTGAQLKGLDTTVPVFTPVNRGIAAPTLYDLVPILRETIVKTRGNKFQPNFLMMNITEINKYKLEKDTNNNYIMPPFVSENGKVIDGMVVVENNLVADNVLYIGDSRQGRIYDAAEGYSLQMGYIDDQFGKDIKTLKARKRTCLLIKDSEKFAYLKVASISAALTALAV